MIVLRWAIHHKVSGNIGCFQSQPEMLIDNKTRSQFGGNQQMLYSLGNMVTTFRTRRINVRPEYISTQIQRISVLSVAGHQHARIKNPPVPAVTTRKNCLVQVISQPVCQWLVVMRMILFHTNMLVKERTNQIKLAADIQTFYSKSIKRFSSYLQSLLISEPTVSDAQ